MVYICMWDSTNSLDDSRQAFSILAELGCTGRVLITVLPYYTKTYIGTCKCALEIISL